MAILCLGRSVKIDFATWLESKKQDLYLVTSTVMPNQDKYRFVKRVADLDADGTAELTAVELAKSTPIDSIIPHSEYDLIRAARLREYLKIQGQSVESAVAYRDKVIMKEYLRRAGIPTAHFRRLNSPLDALTFVEAHGFPVIVKPVDGCSSKGVQLIGNMGTLSSFLQTPASQNYMIESFVPGRMYHVNGVNGPDGASFFAPCEYINNSLDYQKFGIFGSKTIQPETAFGARLVEFTKKVIAALPPTSPLGFHAEIFRTPEDDLVLCEIASRTAGSLTGELIERTYGKNIHKVWIRSMAGMVEDLECPAPPVRYAASIRVPTRDRVLRKLPSAVPFPWVSTFCLTGLEGRMHQPATTYTDDVLSSIILGKDDNELTSRTEEFTDWLNHVIEWA